MMTRLRLMTGHPSVMIMAIASLGATAFLATSAPPWIWLFVPLGVLAQMLNEYSMHRFIFHLPPPTQHWQFDLLYQVHYGHHDFPTTPGLFFVPIWVALPMLVVNSLLAFGLVTLCQVPFALEIAVAIVPVGGVLTFLSYEWFHMTAHLNVRKTWPERHVTALHSQHHFRDFSRWFHVSPGGLLIDRVMGTAIDREALKSQQRLEFIRTLGMSPDDARLVCARRRFAGRYGLSDDEITRAARV